MQSQLRLGSKVVKVSRDIFAIGQVIKDNFCNLILQSNDQEPFTDIDVGTAKQSRAFLKCDAEMTVKIS